MIKKLINRIFDLFFPKQCVRCKISGYYFCPKCIGTIALPLNNQKLPDFVYPAKSYKDPHIKKAIWILKYKKRFDIANDLANFIYDKMIEDLSDLKTFTNFHSPLLVPIPIHKKTLRKRGFNQSEKLAHAVCKIDAGINFTLSDLLEKTKHTGHQARTKSKNERLKNLTNSFSVKKGVSVVGKNIILIDDVITTGATLTEAKRILKLAGA